MHRNKLPALALLAVAAFAPGCTVLRYAHLVCVEEPKLYCEPKDEKASLATYRSLADRAWMERGMSCPEDCLAGDYSWGFREGFAQFVYAGGDGAPPVVPPRPYWQLDLRTAEGAAAVDSWFAGWRAGVQAARNGGYRRTATLKMSASLYDCDACGCPERSEGCDQGDCQGGCSLRTLGPSLATPQVEPQAAPRLDPFETPQQNGAGEPTELAPIETLDSVPEAVQPPTRATQPLSTLRLTRSADSASVFQLVP